MKWGIVNLFCPMCGKRIEYNGNKPSPTYHSREWGRLCSLACYELGNLKYARMILGHNDPLVDANLPIGT